jgi:hypothetical protein
VANIYLDGHYATTVPICNKPLAIQYYAAMHNIIIAEIQGDTIAAGAKSRTNPCVS